jgi:hypothetical protein
MPPTRPQLEATSRQADAQRLEAEKDQAVADAEDAKQAEATRNAAAEWKAGEATKRTEETNRLLTEAAQPDTDPSTVTTNIRKAAVQLLTTAGPWTQQAAASALGGDEASLREFLHMGLAAATEQDDRASIGTLGTARTIPGSSRRPTRPGTDCPKRSLTSWRPGITRASLTTTASPRRKYSTMVARRRERRRIGRSTAHLRTSPNSSGLASTSQPNTMIASR